MLRLGKGVITALMVQKAKLCNMPAAKLHNFFFFSKNIVYFCCIFLLLALLWVIGQWHE